MTIPNAEEVREVKSAVVAFADSRVYPAAVSLVSLAAVILLLVWQREDMREQRTAFLASMAANTHAIERLADEVHVLRAR